MVFTLVKSNKMEPFLVSETLFRALIRSAPLGFFNPSWFAYLYRNSRGTCWLLSYSSIVKFEASQKADLRAECFKIYNRIFNIIGNLIHTSTLKIILIYKIIWYIFYNFIELYISLVILKICFNLVASEVCVRNVNNNIMLELLLQLEASLIFWSFWPMEEEFAWKIS